MPDTDVDLSHARSILATSRLRLDEMEQASTINLRVDLSNIEFGQRLSAILGHSIPSEPNRFVPAGDQTTICLGPNELMIVAPYSDRRSLVLRLEKAAEGIHTAVTDVTGNRVRWRLSGDGSHDFLAAACSIDCHPRSFEPGQCAQTLFARSSAIILKRALEPVFEVHIGRSLNNHLQTWALQAAVDLD